MKNNEIPTNIDKQAKIIKDIEKEKEMFKFAKIYILGARGATEEARKNYKKNRVEQNLKYTNKVRG